MSYTPNYGFGSGVMYGTPSAGTNVTPVRFGVMQDISVDFSSTTKELYGEFQYPVAVGRGTAKITGKAKFARIDAGTLQRIYFNLAGSGDKIIVVDQEPQLVPVSSPYTVTVNDSGTFEQDKGVAYATTGQPLTQVDIASHRRIFLFGQRLHVFVRR